MIDVDEDFEVFRGDVIAYLASRLELPPEDVLHRLGTWLARAREAEQVGMNGAR